MWTRSVVDPGIFLQTNILGTGVLMDACRKYGIQRYHQVSTDEVYGDLPLDRTDLFFTEQTPIHTSSPYSASKASADLLVQAYRSHLRAAGHGIARCSNNYGPYHFPEKLIPFDDRPGAGMIKAAAGVRHRRECPGLAVCDRSLRRH